MLSVFPDLFTYSLFAPLLLRVVVGAFLISKEYAVFKQATTPYVKTKSIIYIIAGVLLCIGLFTQVAALVVALLVAFELWRDGMVKKILSRTETTLFVFILVISLSLMLSGAGFIAIDLPL